MCSPLKFTSLILILTSLLSFLSFHSVSGEDYGPAMSYSNHTVQKYAEDAWEKLLAEGRTRGATIMGFADVYCPHVKTIGEEQRYTFLVIYGAVGAKYVLFCYVYVWTKSHDPLTVDCYHGFWKELKDSSDQKQYDMWYSLYNNKQFCPDDALSKKPG